MENIQKSTLFSASETIGYAAGAIISKTIVKQNNGTITLFSFDKGQALSEHSAPFDAFVQVIEGTALITIDKKPYYLKKGECIIMPANIPHAINAEGQFMMILTMIKG